MTCSCATWSSSRFSLNCRCKMLTNCHPILTKKDIFLLYLAHSGSDFGKKVYTGRQYQSSWCTNSIWHGNRRVSWLFSTPLSWFRNCFRHSLWVRSCENSAGASGDLSTSYLLSLRPQIENSEEETESTGESEKVSIKERARKRRWVDSYSTSQRYFDPISRFRRRTYAIWCSLRPVHPWMIVSKAFSWRNLRLKCSCMLKKNSGKLGKSVKFWVEIRGIIQIIYSPDH